MSLLPCTSICKSQLRFVSRGVFTQLNEDSDLDQQNQTLTSEDKTGFQVLNMHHKYKYTYMNSRHKLLQVLELKQEY